MREIGGYIELDTYRDQMLHEDGILLNSGRGCLWYLLKARKIRKIVLPLYCCDCVREACAKVGTEVRYFSVDEQFLPRDVQLEEGEWLYLVNHYGQLTQEQIRRLKAQYGRLIVDEAQAYFAEPVTGVDTLYTCRKFFGVADGGILYTDADLAEELVTDESFARMGFLLVRYERTASEFYADYVANNEIFAEEGTKRMSKLTQNLLHALDYDFIRERRRANFEFLDRALRKYNRLSVHSVDGAFAYPLMVEHGADIRKALIAEKIYIPCLWPNVLDDAEKGSWDYQLAADILPLPVDQRYGLEDMEYLAEEVQRCIS